MIMRANGNVMAGHEIRSLHAECVRAKEWAKRTLTRERLEGVTAAAFAIVTFGVLFSALYHALQHRTIVGF
jgi:hypothetical protein